MNNEIERLTRHVNLYPQVIEEIDKFLDGFSPMKQMPKQSHRRGHYSDDIWWLKREPSTHPIFFDGWCRRWNWNPCDLRPACAEALFSPGLASRCWILSAPRVGLCQSQWRKIRHENYSVALEKYKQKGSKRMRMAGICPCSPRIPALLTHTVTLVPLAQWFLGLCRLWIWSG